MWLKFNDKVQPEVLINADIIACIRESQYGNSVSIISNNYAVTLSCKNKKKLIEDIWNVLKDPDKSSLHEFTDF